MAAFARKTSDHVSKGARKKLTWLTAFPALESFQNPITRGLTRRLANDVYARNLKSIDFEYYIRDTIYGDVACVEYETSVPTRDNSIILFIHGGGFVCGSPRSQASLVLPACMQTGLRGIGVDYTLAPEARFPTPLDEIDAVYRALLNEELHRKIMIVADTTGCALALGALMRWRDVGVTAPAAIALISPMIDARAISDTHLTHKNLDPVMSSVSGHVTRRLFDHFAPGEALDNPYLSPLYGDFSWAPPMLVHAGTRDICLGDAARLTEKAALQKVDARLRIFDGMFHSFQLDWSLPESRRAHQDIANFFSEHCAG